PFAWGSPCASMIRRACVMTTLSRTKVRCRAGSADRRTWRGHRAARQFYHERRRFEQPVRRVISPGDDPANRTNGRKDARAGAAGRACQPSVALSGAMLREESLMISGSSRPSDLDRAAPGLELALTPAGTLSLRETLDVAPVEAAVEQRIRRA